MDKDVVGGLVFLAVMLWIVGSYVRRLFRTLQTESTERRAAGRGHTWQDSAAIVGFLIAVFALASYGVSGPAILRLVMVSIAVYYGFRQWQDRRSAHREP